MITQRSLKLYLKKFENAPTPTLEISKKGGHYGQLLIIIPIPWAWITEKNELKFEHILSRIIILVEH